MELTMDEIRELRNYLTIGNEEDNVSHMVMDLANETLSKFVKQSDYLHKDNLTVDEVALSHNTDFASLDEFVRAFWDKAVEKILDVAQVQYGTE